MTNLLEQFAAMVADTEFSSFTTQRAQDILDRHRLDVYQEPLSWTAQQVATGSVVYHVFTSQHRNLEGTASGTVAFRLYDSQGTAVTTGYTLDESNGIVRFTANQGGSARYIDARSYDLYGAVADGWRERAGQQAGGYDFRVEGRSYNRSQWFEHCMSMAAQYDSLKTGASGWGYTTSRGVIERGDMC
jgi:hypothetical protein